MPSSQRSVAVTDAYRRRLFVIRNHVAAGVATSWRSTVDLTELDDSFRRWLTGAASITTAGQAQAAMVSDAYLSAYSTSELGRHVPPIGVDTAKYAGRTSYGRPVAELLQPALITVKAAVAAGRSADEASDFGRARAVRNAAYETDSAGRTALADELRTSDRVEGWRRVTGGQPCGACLADATGQVQSPDDDLFVHPFCSCTKEPVISGAADDVSRPTGRELFDSMSDQEQDALFEGRGGAAKADLIRSGEVPLSALITHSDQVSRQTVLTETPLVALRKG